MRTGAEYLESLRDGRKVWVMGEGRVDDVTTHHATSAMVREYVAWYDRHLDAAWQDVLLTPPLAGAPSAAAPGPGAWTGPSSRTGRALAAARDQESCPPQTSHWPRDCRCSPA